MFFHRARRLLLLALACTVAFTASAFGQSKLDERVEQMLSEIGRARVLVVMVAPKLGDPPSSAYNEPAAFIAELLGENGQHIQQIADSPIAVAETDRRGVFALADDPRVSYVFADVPTPPLLDTSLQTLGVKDVHTHGVLGGDYSVAILDTGVNYNHAFLANKIHAEGCFSREVSTVYSVQSLCKNGIDVDITPGSGFSCNLPGCDHGTHVAGIAVGRPTTTADGNIISGVAPDAGLISVQVFTRLDDLHECGIGRTPCIRSFVSDQLLALQHIVDLSASHRVAAVNMSLGSGYYDVPCEQHPLKEEIVKLRESGIATVIASGNRGYYNAVSAPACVSAAITVGASLKDRVELDRRYSNTSAAVDFLAPGTAIMSAVTRGYDYKTGTSMAAPHIAGLFALLKSRAPSVSVDSMEHLLRVTAHRTNDPRTGLALYFPDASRALDELPQYSTEMALLDAAPFLRGAEIEPFFREAETTVASDYGALVGARRLIIRPSSYLRGQELVVRELATQIQRALGRGVVRALSDSLYVAESPLGFSAAGLSTLIAELGADTRVYEDTLVAPD